MGPTDMLFPRFQYVVTGEKFFAGADIIRLCRLYKELNDQTSPTTFLDLVELLQSVSTNELATAGGVWTKLSPGSCLIIPPGWFVMDGSLVEVETFVGIGFY